jgi:hypothetical protein
MAHGEEEGRRGALRRAASRLVTALALLAAACAQVGTEGPVPGERDPYPNLATVPDRPVPSTTPEERRGIVDALIAERDAAKRADQALRAATERK